MHRLIMGDPRGIYIDHVNHNTLDNRRENLRLATNQENQRNQLKQVRQHGCISKYKGVSRDGGGGWKAYFTINYKYIHIGRFQSELVAASAYDAAAIHHFGQFAHTNFDH